MHVMVHLKVGAETQGLRASNGNNSTDALLLNSESICLRKLHAALHGPVPATTDGPLSHTHCAATEHVRCLQHAAQLLRASWSSALLPDTPASRFESQQPSCRNRAVAASRATTYMYSQQSDQSHQMSPVHNACMLLGAAAAAGPPRRRPRPGAARWRACAACSICIGLSIQIHGQPAAATPAGCPQSIGRGQGDGGRGLPCKPPFCAERIVG